MNPSVAIIGLTCRGCLQPANSSIPIFSKSTNSDLSICEMLKFCSLEVKQNENLPETMCLNCMNSIQHFYNFVKIFRNAETFFEEHLLEIMKVKREEKQNNHKVTHMLADDKQTVIIPAELGDHDYNDMVVIKSEVHAKVSGKSKVKRSDRAYLSYECPNCDQKFPKFTEFLHHMREYDMAEIICKACEKTFTSMNYAQHFKENHKFQCETCHERFNEYKALKEHLMSHIVKSETVKKNVTIGSFDCPVCDIKLKKMHSLYSHISSFHNDLSDCKLCGNVKIEGSFLDHFRQDHVFKCKWCPRQFYNDDEGTIQEHYKRHRKPEDMFELDQMVLGEGEPNFIHTCPICVDVGFTTVEHLSDHLENDHSGYIIPCLLCQRQFENAVEFKTHYQNLHTLKENGNYKDHYCPVCGVNFAGFQLFSTHFNHLHQEEASISCHLCPEVFESDVYLHHYSKIHRYQCPLCMKTLSQKHPYTRHIDTHLNKYFVCQIEGCEKAFGAKNSLRQHILNIHNEEKKFLCNECGMAFKSTDGLRYHMKKHRERKFLCTYCGKRFIQSAHLTYHLWTHTGKKPYSCKDCGRSSVSKKLLFKHVEKGLCNKKTIKESVYIKSTANADATDDGHAIFYTWEEDKSIDSEYENNT